MKRCPLCGQLSASMVTVPLGIDMDGAYLKLCGNCYRRAYHEDFGDEDENETMTYTASTNTTELPTWAQDIIRREWAQMRSDSVMDLLEDALGYRPKIKGRDS